MIESMQRTKLLREPNEVLEKLAPLDKDLIRTFLWHFTITQDQFEKFGHFIDRMKDRISESSDLVDWTPQWNDWIEEYNLRSICKGANLFFFLTILSKMPPGTRDRKKIEFMVSKISQITQRISYQDYIGGDAEFQALYVLLSNLDQIPPTKYADFYAELRSIYKRVGVEKYPYGKGISHPKKPVIEPTYCSSDDTKEENQNSTIQSIKTESSQ